MVPGEKGPLASIRLQMLQEGIQLAEVRTCIDKALLDDARRAKLGDELAGRCQKVLDERTVSLIFTYRPTMLILNPGNSSYAWLWYSQGLDQYKKELFSLAKEVKGKLNGS